MAGGVNCFIAKKYTWETTDCFCLHYAWRIIWNHICRSSQQWMNEAWLWKNLITWTFMRSAVLLPVIGWRETEKMLDSMQICLLSPNGYRQGSARIAHQPERSNNVWGCKHLILPKSLTNLPKFCLNFARKIQPNPTKFA